jgi:hypothetical protein
MTHVNHDTKEKGGYTSKESCYLAEMNTCNHGDGGTTPFGWNYKPAEKHCWLIFCERKILFRLKKQAE